jgi:hypothetical protein
LASSLGGRRGHLSMSGDITIVEADLVKPVTSQLSLPTRNWIYERDTYVSAFPTQWYKVQCSSNFHGPPKVTR